MPTPKPAHAIEQAATRSLAAPVNRRAVVTIRRTPPQTNQSTPIRPTKPIETSEFRYWSSKMIGAPVFGSTIAPGSFERATLPVPSPCPNTGACFQLRRPGPRSATRPEPTLPPRTVCDLTIPPLGRKEW